MAKIEVLGIATVDGGRRMYFPNDVLKALKLGIEDRISFDTSGKRIVISEADSGEKGFKIGKQQRVYAPEPVAQRLKLGIGDDVVFLRERRKVTISKLVDRIK